MAKTLIVGTEEFEFPETGDNAGYGESVTDWATAVSTALLTVQARNDIPATTGTIINNATTPTNIPGFSFDTSEVISINCEYIIKRTTVTPAANLVESGFIEGNFDGTNWNINIEYNGTSGVTLDISPSGQVNYTSTNMTGSDYSGSILFKAKVFNSTEE